MRHDDRGGRDDCWIWGLPYVCQPCKRALACGEPNLNPAHCYPTATADDIKDLPLRALPEWRATPSWDRAPVNDLPAEPTTPCTEVVDSSPPEPEIAPLVDSQRLGRGVDDPPAEPTPPCSEVAPMSPPAAKAAPAKVDEGGKDRIAEDGWEIIQRVLRMR
jgi:hypothetical protein